MPLRQTRPPALVAPTAPIVPGVALPLPRGHGVTGHKTEAVYHRYAIVSEADLSEGVGKLSKLRETTSSEPSKVTPFPATGTEGAQNRG
jgi:hypothetical protein